MGLYEVSYKYIPRGGPWSGLPPIGAGPRMLGSGPLPPGPPTDKQWHSMTLAYVSHIIHSLVLSLQFHINSLNYTFFNQGCDNEAPTLQRLSKTLHLP